MCKHDPAQQSAPGLSPLTLRKLCPYMGLFSSVTPARSPGRFRESPPPALPGRAAAPGRGPGFSRAGGFLGAESPRPGSRAPAAGGPCSHEPWEPSERLSTDRRRSPTAPTPPPLDRPWRRVTAAFVVADAVRATPARKGGARPPVSPSRVPGQKPATARSGPVRAVVWAAGRRHNPAPAAEVGGSKLLLTVGIWVPLKLEDPSAKETVPLRWSRGIIQ